MITQADVDQLVALLKEVETVHDIPGMLHKIRESAAAMEAMAERVAKEGFVPGVMLHEMKYWVGKSLPPPDYTIN